MRALIVDDSRFVRDHLQGMLEGMNVACVQAENGRAALEMLAADGLFDLMFCDVNMPVMDGLDCVRAVRRSDRYGGIRVMMVTTQISHELIKQALRDGADEFLMKPFTEEGLREKMLLLGVSAV